MKKKRRTIFIILTLFTVLAATGITFYTNKGENTNINVEEQLIVFNHGEAYSDKGVLYNNKGVINYIDTESGFTTVLCDKPSCKHNSEQCNAEVGDIDILGIYNEKLYFIQSVDGKETFSKFLFQADLNGANRKSIAEIKDVSAIYKAKFTKGKLLLVTSKDYDKETYGRLERPITGLVSIDLENYDIDYIFKSDKTSININQFEYIEDENKILYGYDYVNSQSIKLINEGKPDIGDMCKNTVAELYVYDTKTKESTLLKSLKKASIKYIANGKVLFLNIEGKTGEWDPFIRDGLLYNYKDSREKAVEIKTNSNMTFYDSSKYIISSDYNGDTNTFDFYSFDVNTGTFTKIKNDKEAILCEVTPNYVYIGMKNKKNEDWLYVLEIDNFLNGELSLARPIKQRFMQ